MNEENKFTAQKTIFLSIYLYSVLLWIILFLWSSISDKINYALQDVIDYGLIILFIVLLPLLYFLPEIRSRKKTLIEIKPNSIAITKTPRRKPSKIQTAEFSYSNILWVYFVHKIEIWFEIKDKSAIDDWIFEKEKIIKKTYGIKKVSKYGNIIRVFNIKNIEKLKDELKAKWVNVHEYLLDRYKWWIEVE